MARGVMPRQPAKTGRQEGAMAAARGMQKAARQAALKEVRRAKARELAKPAKAAGAKAGAAKRYNPLNPDRIGGILELLDELYPEATCALIHRNPWELLVATILSAQSTDATVNRVTPALFDKYPTVQAFAALEPEQLEPDIHSTGFFRNKARSVVGAAKRVVSEFGGEIPDEMDKLLTLPGVARKTANVVLGTWFRQGVGIVVDTHVTRISRRLELTKQTDAPKIEQDLMKVIPPEKWILYSHQIIWHGRKVCVARQPKCVDCGLETLCHAADKTWSTVDIHKTAKP